MVDWGIAVAEALGVAVLFACMAGVLYDVLTMNEPERAGGGEPYPKYENYHRPAHCLPCPYRKEGKS